MNGLYLSIYLNNDTNCYLLIDFIDEIRFNILLCYTYNKKGILWLELL